MDNQSNNQRQTTVKEKIDQAVEQINQQYQQALERAGVKTNSDNESQTKN